MQTAPRQGQRYRQLMCSKGLNNNSSSNNNLSNNSNSNNNINSNINRNNN